MTIRQYLDRCAKPYKLGMWYCCAVFGFAGLAMCWGSKYVADLPERTLLSPFGFWVDLIGAAYVGGGLGAIVLGVIGTLRIRCPNCHKWLGVPPKRWKYCHCCGVDFNSEMLDPLGKRDSQSQ